MTPEEFVNQQNAMRELLAEANTCLPAVIVTYDPVARIATVRPSIDKRTADDRVIPAPEIHNVPVVFPSAKSVGAIFCFPLNPGDGGTLHFSQRSLDEWLDGQRVPLDPRTHDLNDCLFYPGADPVDQVVPAEGDCMLIKIGLASFRLYGDGRAVVDLPAGFQINTPLASFSNDVTAEGTITGNVDVIAAGISGKGHTHIEQGDGKPVSKPQ